MTRASKNYAQYKDAETNAALYWPANLVDVYDYLQIDLAKYVPKYRSTGASVSTQQSAATAAPTESSFNIGIDFNYGIDYTGFNIGGIFSSILSFTLKNEKQILLPIPDDVAYKDNPQWSDQSVGVMGRFGGELAGKLMDGASSEGITDTITKAAGAGKFGVISDMIKKLGADPNAAFQNINGKVMNPYMEQVFSGVGLRQFDFTWKLVPRNKREQESIQKIIKTLRQSVLPNIESTFGADSLDTQAGNNTERWLTVPDVFILQWKSKGKPITSLPRLKPCVCKDIQVQYTPDNVWATHMDADNPYPVAYNLTMSFGEMEIVTSKDVATGGY